MLYAALAGRAILAVIGNHLTEGQITLVRLDGIMEQHITAPLLGQLLQRLCPMQMSSGLVCVCVRERVKGEQSFLRILQLVGIEIRLGLDAMQRIGAAKFAKSLRD